MKKKSANLDRGIDGGGPRARRRIEVEALLQASAAFMAREFRRKPPLAEIARVAHISEYHFHRLFLKQFGRTPKQMLDDLQIEEVKRLMLWGFRAYDAARLAGFSHQSHMNARFRKAMGMTPVQWLEARRH